MTGYEHRPGGEAGDARSGQPTAKTRRDAVIGEARRAGADVEERDDGSLVIRWPTEKR